MNYYKRHLGDIAKSCAHLSQGRFGAYDLLLDWHYANEKPIPLDEASAYNIGRAKTKAERENVDYVLGHLFTRTDAGYVQKRAGEEMARAAAIAETNHRIAVEREERNRAAREARSERDHDTGCARPVQRNEHEACTNRAQSVNQATSHKPLATISVGNSPGVGYVEVSATDPPTDPPGDGKQPLAANVQAAKAMIAAGCVSTRVNPSHAALIAACNAGVTPQMLADTVREALDRSPPIDDPFPWAIRVAHNRLTEAGKRPSPAKHSAADDFRGKSYDGTDITKLPQHLRDAVAAELAAGG